VTDADLVARAKQGDHAAFGELVDRHRMGVYRAARAALGSHAEAEDAAQDAFVLAWRRLDSFRADASFRTWLLTIAWHQAINRRRSLLRWWTRTMPLEEGEAPAGAAAPCATASRELRRDIVIAIRALSPKLRDALLLAQSGDYTYAEIGTMVHAPLGTIKWRIAEARRLVQRLQELGHGQLG